MRLSSLLHPQRIRCGLSAASKEEALREMVGLVSSTTEGALDEDILAALAEREKQGPFSMSKGSAFPHARTDKVPEFTVALGTSREGIDFRSPDGAPIRVIVLFAIPKQHSNLYLHTLAAFLSFFQVEEHLDRVLAAKTGGELIAIIDELGPKPKDPEDDRLAYRPVIPCQLDTPVGQASDRLKRSGLEALPIVDTVGDLLGEVRGESLDGAAGKEHTKETTPLSGFPDLLVRNSLSTIQEEDSPQDAARKLSEQKLPYAYVLRGRRLLGRITVRDLPKP